MTEPQQTSSNPYFERRSKLYFVVGNVLVLCIVLSFIGFMIRNYFQNTLWKDHYYKNAYKFSEVCTAQFTGSDDLTFPLFLKPAQALGGLPHPRGFFDSWDAKTSDFYHALYNCDIPTSGIRIGKGVNYMHVGWIFGEVIEISIDERKAIEIKGDDFVSFPIGYKELAKPILNMQIRVSSKNRHRFGLASILPPVITTETKDHFSVLGIQPIYEMMNVVLPLIPAVVLGVLLSFAWILGLRTRIVLTGMFYFASALASGALPLMIPYLPFSATKIYTIGLPLVYLSHAAVLCLMMEVFGIFKAKIYHLMNGCLTVTSLAIVVFLSWDGVFPYSQLVAKFLDTVMLIFWILLGVVGSRIAIQESLKIKKALYGISLLLVAAIIYRFTHDIFRHFEWNSFVSIDFYYSFAMPLFIAGIVFYYLSTIEAQLREVRYEKRQLSQGLAVTRELLSIVKDSAAAIRCGFVEIRWQGDLSSINAWKDAWVCSNGDVVIVCGHFKGTEDLAGLGQVAIQSALIQCREQNISEPSSCLEYLNRSLVELFHNYVRSSATAILIRKDFSASYASLGGVFLTASDSGRMSSESGELLGGSKKLTFSTSSFQMTAKTVITFAADELDDPAISSYSLDIRAAA